MMAGTQTNALVAQNLCDVVRMNAVDGKADAASTVVGVLRTENREAGNTIQAFLRMLQQ